jgi:hypothetical protein
MLDMNGGLASSLPGARTLNCRVKLEDITLLSGRDRQRYQRRVNRGTGSGCRGKRDVVSRSGGPRTSASAASTPVSLQPAAVRNATERQREREKEPCELVEPQFFFTPQH